MGSGHDSAATLTGVARLMQQREVTHPFRIPEAADQRI
jgi:hypothetical protein